MWAIRAHATYVPFVELESDNVGIGTTGPTSKLEVRGDVEFNENQFFVDDSTGNIGVGTTAPTAELHVAGGAPSLKIGNAVAEDTSIVFDGNAEDFYIGLDDSTDDFVIGEDATVGSAVRLLIQDDTGIIGVGTVTPSAMFHVNNSGGQGTFTVSSDGGGSNEMLLEVADRGRTVLRNYSGGGGVGNGAVLKLEQQSATAADTYPVLHLMSDDLSSKDAEIRFENDANIFTMGIDATGDVFKIADSTALGSTDRLTINASGNVGLGITAPSHILHVAGTTTYPGMMVERAGSGGTASYGAKNTDGTVYFGLSATEKWAVGTNINLDVSTSMSIDTSSGNIGIGNTAPGAKLEVTGLGAVCNGTCGTKTGATAAGDLYVEGDLEVDTLPRTDNGYTAPAAANAYYVCWNKSTGEIYASSSSCR